LRLLVGGVFFLAVAAPARGAPAKTKVTVFLVPAKGFKTHTLVRVSRAMSKALRKNAKLDMEDSDKLLVQFSGEAPNADIAEAERLYNQGVTQLQAGDTAGALQSLETSYTAYVRVLAYVKKKKVARAALARAVAQAESGMQAEALANLKRLLTWRPHMRFDTKRFNARHIPLFERARTHVKRLKRGSVELSTEPAGAKAYVDGRFMGVTPTVVYGLKVGEHYATFKKPGFVKAAQKIQVSPKAQKQYSQELRRSDKFLLLKQSLAAARQGLGRARANAGMTDLRSFLYIDQVVFVTVGYGGPGSLSLQAYLYDLRSKLRLNTTTVTVDTQTLAGVETLATNLYLNARYDGSLEAPPEAPPPPPKKRTPLYAAWWFWAAVGVGVATAIVLPITLWPESDTCGGPCFYHQN
jgi:hypothetical protein